MPRSWNQNKATVGPVLGVPGGTEAGLGPARRKRGRRDDEGQEPIPLQHAGRAGLVALGEQGEPGRNAVSSLTLQLVSPGQGGGTWAGQGGEGLSGAAHAVPAL